MSISDSYMSLQFDISGSRTKNRYRNEVLWGLEKIYEVYRTGQDFVAIFDYMCDIEIHLNENLEFYQVKTKSPSTPFTLPNLTQSKNGSSIIGTLYRLKSSIKEPSNKVELAIVTNTALRDLNKTLHSSYDKIRLTMLDNDCRVYIANRLAEELGINPNDFLADCDAISYIYTSMDLYNPHHSLLGQTVQFFIEVKNEEPKKPASLFRLLSDTIEEKACNERAFSTYAEVVNKKGLTRKQLDHILNKYTENTQNAVSLCMVHIETYADYQHRVVMKRALSRMNLLLEKSIDLQIIEGQIAEYIDSNLARLGNDDETIILNLASIFSNSFPLEYSDDERKAFILLVMKKYEENVYVINDNQ